jgi:clan AA aspartic protease
MMSGQVTAEGEIALKLVLADPPSAPIEAIVDTGFNGELTLPSDLLQLLGAIPAGTRTAELADGSLVLMNVYAVRILWYGKPCDVMAMEADSTPLVGMALLWGSRVTFDARDQGPMAIDEITPAPTP